MIITGTYPREYEVFTLFYSTLVKTLWGYTDELCIFFQKDHVITSYEEKIIMNTPRSYRTQLLLTELAIKLRNGDDTLFKNVLRIIEKNIKDPNIQQLTTKIHTAFDQDRSIGM